MSQSSQPPAEDGLRDDGQSCRYCDGTGDVHGLDGEWRGVCNSCLLPCPFCGNEQNIAMVNERHDHSGGYFIACPECDASTGLRYATGDDPRPLLMEQWNRRAKGVGLVFVGEIVARGALGGTLAQVRNGLPVGAKLYTYPTAASRAAESRDDQTHE